MDHVDETIQTYNNIAKDYNLIASPKHRSWLKSSMDMFIRFLTIDDSQGAGRILVPGCGEGRDSKYFRELHYHVDSFDLSDAMLEIAKKNDVAGNYFRHDLREIDEFPNGVYNGIWACACLYHLTKREMVECIKSIWDLLDPNGVLFCNFKIGEGEKMIAVPRDGYPGGEIAKANLTGNRFYSFYQKEEIIDLFSDFELLHTRKDLLQEGEGAYEFYFKKS